MQTVVAHEGLLSRLGYEFNLCYTRIGVFVNPTCQLATGYVVPLVQATEWGSGAGSFRRLTVDISSSPSRMLAPHRALRGCWRLIEPFEDAGASSSPSRMLAPTLASSKPPVSLSKQGDIPGAYWAALTQPATTQDIVSRIFAGVHMLSHVVGTANRADIRRLRQLEADNVLLAANVERQQRQLHEGFVERDRTIRELNELLSTWASERSERPSDHER